MRPADLSCPSSSVHRCPSHTSPATTVVPVPQAPARPRGSAGVCRSVSPAGRPPAPRLTVLSRSAQLKPEPTASKRFCLPWVLVERQPTLPVELSGAAGVCRGPVHSGSCLPGSARPAARFLVSTGSSSAPAADFLRARQARTGGIPLAASSHLREGLLPPRCCQEPPAGLMSPKLALPPEPAAAPTRESCLSANKDVIEPNE